MMNEIHHIDFTRVFDILSYQQKKYPQSKTLNGKQKDNWKSYSIEEVIKQANLISCWLIENNYQKGDRVAVMPRMGSPEWLMVDFACQQAGLILVPVHPTATLEEVTFILNETHAKMCIAADIALYEKLIPLKETTSCKHLFHLEHLDDSNFLSLIKNETTLNLAAELEIRKNQILPEDLLAILYTSGTSGTPKGVMLTHANVVSSVKSMLTILPLNPGHRVLSFLPFSHIFERTASFTYMAFGAEIYFSQRLDELNHDFKSVKPVCCTTVPKTLEKMYDILSEKLLEKNMVKRNVIRWAMLVGEKYKDKQRQGVLYRIKLVVARILVLNTFRKALGGKIKFMAVGAAALNPNVGRLFSAAGILTLSGYGMTEASPFISVNRTEPGLNQFGTVGIPVPGVQIKIDEPNENGEGEILVKGPNIMQGYYNRPEQTREVFTDDGWFRTGDVGKMVNKRFLAITDRKKDIFKTSAGKYVAPQVLENYFTTSAFIMQCLILGFNKPFVSAVLVPNYSLLKTWCEEQGIHWTAPTYMIHNIKVIRKIQGEVDRLNETLQGFERIKKFILSEEEWTVENKDLTTSFKPRRAKLLEKHKNEIEKMYR
jgi:long-chain acyl-CoA synthetase